jgi:uncharacterized protein (DUF342 family)
MPNYYELKQTTLMELEIAELITKIQRLEKELALKEQEIKQLKMLTLALEDIK